MAARLSLLLPRFAVLTFVWLLATSAITFAAVDGSSNKAPDAAAPASEARELVVPDVRRQAYVFAKGILEEGGFAWRVTGSVQGYSANTVAVQVPAPGTKIVDNGSPTIVLRLQRNPGYPEHGLPENTSPHKGTPVVLANAPKAPVKAAPKKKQQPKAPKEQPAAAPKKQQKPQASQGREPAFHVAGAPVEPRDEMPLPARARLLESRLAAAERPTPELLRYWRYQHAWLVTGAKFGWSGGAKALRRLVRVEQDLQARWGIGAQSESVARAALAQVERRTAG